MSPTNNEASAGMQLPPPVEQAPPMAGSSETVPGQPEHGPAAAEQLLTPPTPALVTPTVLPLPPVMPAGGSAAPAVPVSATDIQTADDGDLIEKEWVNKAKAIVERNRDDPFRQSEELTVVKADYMKKRYNKAIKLSK